MPAPSTMGGRCAAAATAAAGSMGMAVATADGCGCSGSTCVCVRGCGAAAASSSSKKNPGGCRHVAAQKKLKQLHQQQSWVDVPPHGGSAPPPSRGCFLCRFPWSSEFPKGDTTGSGSSRLSAFKSPKLSKVPACTFNAGGASPSCGTQQWGNAATWRQ